MAVESCHICKRPRKVRRCVLWSVFGLCFVIFGVSRWVLWPVKISGDSMVPNYYDGQPNYINKLAYLSHTPERGDVVGVEVGREFYLKRVVGLPGEKIEFHRGTVMVNNRPLSEPYIAHPLLWALPPVHLGPDQYFIMGDNRTLSMLGAVGRNAIVGKALF